MGGFYSIYKTEDRKLIQILKEEDSLSKDNFQRLKVALAFKKNLIVDEYGNKRLNIELLVHINNIISNGFNEKVHAVKFWEPFWYSEPKIDSFQQQDRLQEIIVRYSVDIISKKDFVNAFIDINPFIFGNRMTSKILFV